MKKTLIALMALTGAAFAGTGTITLNGTTANSPIIATSELTLANLTTITSVANTNKALLGITLDGGVNNETGQENDDLNWSASVGSWSGTCELRIYNKQGGEAISGNSAGSFTYNIDGGSTSTLNMKDYFSLKNAVKGAITFAYAGTHATQTAEGTAVVLSVLYEDGTIKSLYGINTGYKYSNNTPIAITYNTDLLGTPVVTTNVDWSASSLVAAHSDLLLVPEPTTATLSLLALAGLCARRRRK